MQSSHSTYTEQSMNSTAVYHLPDPLLLLLQAAAESVGGEKQLAARLGIAQSLLGKLMTDLHHAPGLREAKNDIAHGPSVPPPCRRNASDSGGPLPTKGYAKAADNYERVAITLGLMERPKAVAPGDVISN
jgi:hypothetical protein